MHRVIIDTDTGIDDAHAHILALMSPEIHIEGMTTVWGNTDVEHCTRNTLYILEMMGRSDIPVRMGVGRSLLRGPAAGAGKMVHGQKGLGTFELPEPKSSVADGNAITWLVDTVMASPGEIELLVLGPMTNIALALSIEPRLAQAIKRIIFMGGVIQGAGNVGPVSTANIANDPEAARIVFHAGAPIVMVGQDVTRFARHTAERFARLKAAQTPWTDFLVEVSTFYAAAYGRGEPARDGFPSHDMLVAAYLLKPEIFRTKRLYVDVDCGRDIARGQTVADFREASPHTPQMDVCVECDNDALFELYLGRVTQQSVPAASVARTA